MGSGDVAAWCRRQVMPRKRVPRKQHVAVSRCSFFLRIFVGLLLFAGVYMLFFGLPDLRTLENEALLTIDRLTCSEIHAGEVPENLRLQSSNAPVPTQSIKDGGGHAWPQKDERPAELRVPPELATIGYRPPRIYIADKEAWSVFNQRQEACAPNSIRESERIMYLLIKSNVTYSVVTDPKEAEWIFIPFFSVITCGTSIDDEHPNFYDVFEAVRPLGTRFILFTTRPWNARTLVRMRTHSIVRRFRDLVVWSPEIRTLQPYHVRRPSPSLMRHVALQQPPLLMEIPEHVFDPSWTRDHMFCFQGTQLNRQRTITAEILRDRGDSFVYATCRANRQHLMYTKLAPGSSRKVYATCEYCIMPMGDSLTDQRFFDAMMVGCIPIIYEPLKPLPFAQFLDYSKFTRHIPQPTSKAKLARQLRKLAAETPQERAAARKALLHAIRSISFANEHNNAGLHFALALSTMSAIRDPDPQLQEAAKRINRVADLEGWWGISRRLRKAKKQNHKHKH